MGLKNKRSEEEKGGKNKRLPTNQNENNKKDDSNSKITSNKHNNPSSPDNLDNERKYFPNLKVLLVCAVCCGIIHSFHVSMLFENSIHFSHLSTREREMSFRTEMGFYYSYYKVIIEADSFVAGLNKLMNDNRTEYPDTINTLQRFNLYPELILGGTYRLFVQTLSSLGIPLPRICWQVTRGNSMPAVVSCEGIGDPIYWYLAGVWICAGCTSALIFVSGAQLSRSLAGGFLAVLCFFFNHGEATRVQWTPPLRESFAFPLSLALNIIITHSLRKPKVSWVQSFLFGNIALNYILCWQFAQFTLVINIGLLYVIYAIGIAPPMPMLLCLIGMIYALFNALAYQFGNTLLLASPLAGTLLGILLLYVFIEPLLKTLPAPTNVGTQLGFLIISALASKIELSRIFGIEDDEHIVNLFKAKLSYYSDFHTLLYTCSKEFDFLGRETITNLSETLLLPGACLAVFLFVISTLKILKNNFIKRIDEKDYEKTPFWKGTDAAVTFNVALLLAFGVMAGLVMRLKLFFTPQLCVVVSLLTCRYHWPVIKTKTVHWSILAVLVSFMCVKGFKNLSDQHSIVGEYSNPDFEELLHWIDTEVGPETSFAGPMPTMANVLLSTGHPIINHPHYEYAPLRQKTKAIYSIASRRSPAEVYETLLGLKVNYIILVESWCLRRSHPGCGMVDIWDKIEPQNAHRPALCPKLFHYSPSPFHKVFSNENYVVLQVPSKYVEILTPRSHSA